MNNNDNSTLSVILTGATGMVGEAVLHECLQHPSVEKVLALTRKPCGIAHPKLKEIIHANFFDIQPLQQQLTGYNSCFFCLGVSSVGMDEEKYFQATYILTTHFAQTLAALNPGMTFCYISGAGTDSSEKGKRMWARIKGKTENALMKLPFKAVYNFRPGILEPTKGLKNTLPVYKYMGWLLPVIRFIFPKYISSLKQLALAMINASKRGFHKNILEIADIVELSGS